MRISRCVPTKGKSSLRLKKTKETAETNEFHDMVLTSQVKLQKCPGSHSQYPLSKACQVLCKKPKHNSEKKNGNSLKKFHNKERTLS